MCLLPDAFYSALKKSGFCGTKPALFVFSSILYMTSTGKSIRRYYLFEQILYLFLFLTYSPPILGRINDFDRMSVVLKSIEFSEDRPNLAVGDAF